MADHHQPTPASAAKKFFTLLRLEKKISVPFISMPFLLD